MYANAAGRLMMLASIKNQADLVKAIYISVLDTYGFTGVFTLFYTLVMARRIANVGELVRPGPDAGAGDHLGYEMSKRIVVYDFDGAWKMFKERYIEGDLDEDIHLGTLAYLINAVGAAAIDTAFKLLSDEDGPTSSSAP